MNIKTILGRYLRQYRLRAQIKDLAVLRQVDLSQSFKEGPNNSSTIKTKEKRRVPAIAFVIPGMPKGSGGHTSILRLGTYLSEFGHEVFYISYLPQKGTAMISNARWNLQGFKGTILGPKALNELKVDIGVATYWVSAYYLQKMVNVHYRAYFVQDYEPDFYPAGDIRTFVENTYRMGYHMVSLGSWNKKRIEEEIGAVVDAIVFPYEIHEYGPNARYETKLEKGKDVKICAYLKGAEKRGGALLLMGLEELYKNARTHGINIQISFFGDNKRIKYPISVPYRNLGVLSKQELKELYRESDFGVVFSYTNISLVPLEMMACGCPVIETSEGSFKHFFNSDCAILVDSYPKDFVRKVTYYIEHPGERKKIAEKAMNSLQGKTWMEAARQFREILVESYQRRAV